MQNKIKIFILVLLFSCTAQFAFSQVEEADEGQRTLSEIMTINQSSIYAATALKFSSIKGDFAFLMGGYGGWFVNKQLLIGGGGFGLLGNNIVVDREDKVIPQGANPDNYFASYDLGYGGLMIEYTLKSDQLVHGAFSVLVGGGGVKQKPEEGPSLTGTSVFVLEPVANLEINVFRYMRTGFGLGYRMVSGSHTRGITDSDLSAFSGNITLKFGFFD